MKRGWAMAKSIGSMVGVAGAIGAAVTGVALAQTWWGSAQQGPRVENRAYFPVRHCINMGGALEAPNEGDWGYRITRADLSAIKAAGFDTIRVPIKWSAHAMAQAPYTIDPAFRSRVDEVMDWALENNLNIIINVHHYDELYADPNRHEVRLAGIWSQIATWYRNAPPGVMFEIINEPRDAFSGDRINRVQQSILADIRRTNPTRTVILTGDGWGGLDGMDTLRMPADPYVVGTVHYYGPFEFTHQGAEWLPNAPPAGRSWPQAGDRQQLSNDIARMARFRDRIGAPVLMGEFGTGTQIPLAQRVSWTADVSRQFAMINMPTCHFDFGSSFAAYDKANRRWYPGMLEALGVRR
jgi:endoglucanase